MSFKFEKLEVWKRSLEINDKINAIVKGFPSDEKYALASQMKRASDWICLNIAEGSSGQTDREFRRFLGISLRSTFEVVACLHLARRRSLIDDATFNDCYSESVQITRMLQSFRSALNK